LAEKAWEASHSDATAQDAKRSDERVTDERQETDDSWKDCEKPMAEHHRRR
jgi:hypothetical protein